ncbi:MAG: hypothetical protein K2X81_23915 [Candidatus Obscuribacterales bacterium]|nr:hypothetical protein [Candidatus Obscuribacterales bacterium]
MKSKILTTFCCMLGILSLSATSVAMADTVTSKPTSASSKGSDAPLMVLGVPAGFVAGTPICFLRRFAHDEASGTRGIVGESNNKMLLLPAGAVYLPFAIFTSFVEAPVYAFRNSWMADKPFSKDQFSLGEMPEYDSTEILKNSD